MVVPIVEVWLSSVSKEAMALNALYRHADVSEGGSVRIVVTCPFADRRQRSSKILTHCEVLVSGIDIPRAFQAKSTQPLSTRSDLVHIVGGKPLENVLCEVQFFTHKGIDLRSLLLLLCRIQLIQLVSAEEDATNGQTDYAVGKYLKDANSHRCLFRIGKRSKV